jgi:transketolase
MRVEFASAILDIAKRDERIAFLSGDLGFMALEEIQNALKERFINCGVAEQNMMSVAAGLAARGFIPVTYSIAPFATMRPFEQIRNDICLHNLPVKIVGNGGGYGYGIMGATHHALEDVAIMRSLPNMSVYVPCFGSDVAKGVRHMIEQKGPAYLRLGKSVPDFGEVSSSSAWSDFRRIKKGRSVIVIAMGPVIENVIQSLPDLPSDTVELWSVGSFPVRDLPEEFTEAVKRVKKVITLEEHYRSGGLAESLGTFFANLSADKLTFINLCAEGYPSGLYGSQRWHQEESGLAGSKLYDTIIGAVNR